MESDVMDSEGSLHQKPREVCTTEGTEPIDLGWFEDTLLNCVKNGRSTPTMIQKGFCETVAEVMDAEAEEEDEIHPSKNHE